jgi:AraC family transcriptional regulator
MDFISNESRRIYISRINKVQDYIEKHLDEELNVDQLARIASFSSFHFQRIYRQMTGESLYSYIKRLRLEKSVFLIRASGKRALQDIALSVGFSSQASFAKALKAYYGISASRIRALNDTEFMEIGRNRFRNNISRNGKVYDEKISYTTPMELSIRSIKSTKVLYLRHTGPYKGNADLFHKLFTKLYSCADSLKLISNESKWFVVYHDFSDLTAEEQTRLSVCLSVTDDTEGFVEFGSMVLEGGKYAVGTFLLNKDEYQQAWNYMMAKWLPESGYMPDDRMCFEYYPPYRNREGKEGNMVEIFIPITPLD